MFDLCVYVYYSRALLQEIKCVYVLHCNVVDGAQMATWIQLVRFAAVAR